MLNKFIIKPVKAILLALLLNSIQLLALLVTLKSMALFTIVFFSSCVNTIYVNEYDI